MKYTAFTIILILLCWGCASDKQPESNSLPHTIVEPTSPTEEIDYDSTYWTEITASESIKLDIRYATAVNFTKQKIYDCPRCFLRKPTANKLKKVLRKLDDLKLGLIIYDCYRPHSAQKKLWEIAPNPIYVADPKEGSMHNKGLAIDLSLMDKNGRPLNMGSDYDHFGPESHHSFTDLDSQVLHNRQQLRSVMMQNGFVDISSEWWHYSDPSTLSKIEDYVWNCIK